jgi:hypothetical protein
VVREKVFGPKLRTEDKSVDDRRVAEAVNGAEKDEPEVEYVRGPEEEARMRRMKLRTLEEIEGELESRNSEPRKKPCPPGNRPPKGSLETRP